MTIKSSRTEIDGPSATQTLAQGMATALGFNGIVLLSGPVGAGKSVFARALIKGLFGEDTVVPSPTFTLVQVYERDGVRLSHFDLYRLDHPDDILELGWEEAVADGIVLVEWPEKLGPYTPAGAVRVDIILTGPETREIIVHGIA